MKNENAVHDVCCAEDVSCEMNSPKDVASFNNLKSIMYVSLPSTIVPKKDVAMLHLTNEGINYVRCCRFGAEQLVVCAMASGFAGLVAQRAYQISVYRQRLIPY
jgi:hypothetical protein